MKRIIFLLFIPILLSTLSCVSMDEIVMRKAGEILSSDSSGTVFTGDNDPQLVADSLPLVMKMYEMVLTEQPENPDLAFAAGRNFILYANAFIQTPAEMFPDEDYLQNEKMLKRAAAMYLRGRNYIMDSLEITYPGTKEMLAREDFDSALSLFNKEDVPRLYWAASGWIGAYSCDPFDFQMSTDLHVPTALLLRALELDESYGQGSIHSIMIQVTASLPEVFISKAAESSPGVIAPFLELYYSSRDIGNNKRKRAVHHFERTVELSEGSNPSPFIALAKSIAVPEQNYPMFEELLTRAVSINPEEYPEKRLEITIFRDKASWMLENRENYFILDFDN